MKKSMGIDIGTNSIGWAFIEKNKHLRNGIRIFENERAYNRKERRVRKRFTKKALAYYQNNISIKRNQVFIALLACSLFTGILAAVNFINWQFWLNLSLTTFVTTLTSYNKK